VARFLLNGERDQEMTDAFGLPDHEKPAAPRSRGRRAAAAVSLSVISFLVGCTASSDKASTARANTPQTIQVTVAAVQQQDLPIYLNGLGSAEAYYTVNVKTRVDGQLQNVKFREGEFVKKGDLLAVIDPRPYQALLDEAQAQVFKDQAARRDAQLNYERYKRLLQESGAVSQQQVDTQKATADQLEGTVRNDQALVDNARLNLSYCHITAPESGRIGLRLVDPGNMVHATDANPLLVITQLQPITVIFTLPEDQLQTVAQRMQKATLPVDAYGRDDQTKLATGKLLTIDNQIDQTTGTGRLKAVFENQGNELWPNQFVNIHLLLETKKSAIVIPAAAVQRGPQGSYVYLVKPDKTVTVRPVNIAVTQDNVAQIASGVAPGEIVVTDGQDKLQENSHVEPHQQAAANGAQNAARPGNPNPGATGSGNLAPGSPARDNPGPGNARPRNRKASDSGTSNSGIASQ
jgi:multidrug efflux system membrane fusion protein